MRILTLDFETTGLDLEKDLPIEIGACLFDLDTHRMMATYGSIIEQDVEMDDEVIGIHGVTNEILKELGVPQKEVVKHMKGLIGECEWIVAHNAPFDKPFALMLDEDLFNSKKWFCSLGDIEYERVFTLAHICFEVGTPTLKAHDACSDAIMAAYLVDWAYQRQGDMFERSLEPRYRVEVHGKAFDYNRDLKDRKFRWDPDNKHWFKICQKEEATQHKNWVKRETKNLTIRGGEVERPY